MTILGEGSEDDVPTFDSEYAHFNNSQVNKLILNPPSIVSLTDEDLNGIGFKAARTILGASNPLQTWAYLTQNFPKHAHLVAKKKIKKDGCTGVSFGQDFFRRSNAPDLLLVNGVPVSLPEVDVFRFIDLLRIEQSTIQSFKSLGINSSDAIVFLKKGASSESADDDTFANTFDVRDKSEGGRVALWLNDLELDEMYEQWASGLDELTGGMYGGYLPEVRLNYASVLFVFDMSAPENLETIVTDILPLIESKVPIRFGLVALASGSDEDQSSAVSAILSHLQFIGGRKGLVSSLKAIYKDASQDGQSVLDIARSLLENLLEKEEEPTNLDGLLSSKRAQEQLGYTRQYMKRLNLDIKSPLFFVNGKRLSFEGGYQRPLLSALNAQLAFLKQKIYSAEINDDINVYDFLLSQPAVYKSFNPLVFGPEGDGQGFQYTSYLGSSPELVLMLDELVYFVNDDIVDEPEQPLASILLFADLNSPEGIELITRAVRFLKGNVRARVAFVHNLQSSNRKGYSSGVYRHAQDGETNHTPVSNLKAEAETEDGETEYWLTAHQALSDSGLSLSSPFILINGKIIPLQKQSDFELVDLETLCSFEFNKRLGRLRPIIAAFQAYADLETSRERANMFMRVSGMLGSNLDAHAKIARFESSPGARKILPEFEADACRHTTGTPDGAWAHIVYILNPLAKEGQRWAPILEQLSRMDGIYLEGYLSPSNDVDDAKRLTKQFYRYVLVPRLTFEAETTAPHAIRFTQLPTDALLTTGLDTISAWLVTPTRSVHDLDNIELGKVAQGVEAEFELKNLLVEGHARDTTTQSSPRGLEFILGTAKDPAFVDTVVMANLGYFQLKANPGVFHMGLREGRSAQLYDIRTIGLQGFTTSLKTDTHRELVLNGFGGAILFPRVSKKPGMEQHSLLGEDARASKGIWSSISKTLFGSKPQPKNHTINVFTVASGHLYERFLSVMILSVIKNTSSPVKFWFIENFLSPSFKTFIPKMATQYGFDFELVTYQWPHWLNHQTEKQRIIWGYKILFLDVLFPLDVDKVIFVDADQVVRADLKELVDMDLDGAPYGYVPFCKSRESMKGYRFWEQGYWADHLDGKPYHISALYVVDLKQFRALAAGDQLRGHYQMLSYDPNSLANLDQDLPNHLQPKMPIFSLPVEWLWCETWCDDDSLKRAKTIDLCNNPETKEPKLDRARRILPEWQIYDSEIAPLRDVAFQVSPSPKKPDSTEEEPDEL
ncbi:killer toxin resistant protein [Entomophthora muscae]|uniref:Killer toxin resistant protein n=1 Tax=Entomophthora muscae TaxID=34485 RepID=A0ACC2SGX7_9FUNG|nr:killer toxin resistant protein [Entomophthora muscae]